MKLKPALFVMSAIPFITMFGDTSSAVWASALQVWVPGELVRNILQDPQVGHFLHIELPERQPLVVCGGLVGPDFEPGLLEFQVRVIPAGDAGCARAFHFIRVDYGPTRAVVDFSYPPEGLRGRFKFVRKDGSWVLKVRRLWEE
jgi:hypothetical protein